MRGALPSAGVPPEFGLEFQHPRIGDTIGYGPNRMRLERVEPERVLAWRSEDGNWVWSFVLDPGSGSTRLISRNRFRLPTLAVRLGMLPVEPASLVMERKMLRASGSAPNDSPRNGADVISGPPGPGFGGVTRSCWAVVSRRPVAFLRIEGGVRSLAPPGFLTRWQ